jgi:ADP-ribosylglycohydrolase
VAALLLIERGFSAKQAIAEVRAARKGAIETSEQEDFLHNYKKTLTRSSHTDVQARERFHGCLLGGAVGDALGAPVEFMSRNQILASFGPEGIKDYAPAYGGLGTITDDTQMTLFTAEGLLRSAVRGMTKGITSYRSVTAHAYLRWLRTQGSDNVQIFEFGDGGGWLVGQQGLYHRRAPGNTCLSALESMTGLGELAVNDSKGCGGVMRVAPVGLFFWRRGKTSPETVSQAFEVGCELAAITHGHPTGQLTAGVLAVLILHLADGRRLSEALLIAIGCLKDHRGHQETLHAIEHAQALAAAGTAPELAITALGEGWVAEEALAIAIYCALVAKDFRHGVLLAVNHDGDSDSTGAITGNLLGAYYGVGAIPNEWQEGLELKDVTTELAEDLYGYPDWPIDDYESGPEADAIWDKYPGY